MNLVRPSNCSPGTASGAHMRAHAELAALNGVTEEKSSSQTGVVVDR